jgi:photosystem II stability/assembly factor-like uncharacterized protein
MRTILAGTDEGLHVLASGEPPVVKLAGHEVNALVHDEASWWAIGGGQEVWCSERDGAWAQQAAAPEELRLNCLAPSPVGLLAGTSEARLLRLVAAALVPVDSFDQAEGRENWYTPWGGPPDSRSIAVDAAGTIFVNVHVGGVVRSRNAGHSWEPTIDIDSDVHQVIAADARPGLVLAASAEGVAQSEDGGDSWDLLTDGLHGGYCRAVAVAGGTLLVSASEGHRGRRSALYRRPLDGSGPFVKCEHGLPRFFGSNIDTHCLAAAGTDAAFGTDEGQVYVSEDAGETWETLSPGLPSIRCLAFA